MTIILVSAVAAEASPARAEIMLEQYETERPPEADEIMAVLRSEFRNSTVIASPRQVAERLVLPPRPAIQDSTLTSEALGDEFELAVKSYIHVNYKLAQVQLTNALARADANCGLITQDPKARYAMSRAQVALALTYKKQSEKLAQQITAQKLDGRQPAPGVVAAKKELDAKAAEAMVTYIRSSRDPVVRSMFGPPGEELYNEVRKTLDPANRTNLSITVSDPAVQLVVNGTPVGKDGRYSGDHLPGQYCIIVRMGSRMLRYDVALAAGRGVALDIKWVFDTKLNVSDTWVGLTVPPYTPPSAYIHTISARMEGQSAFVLVGMRRERSYLRVQGYHYVHAEHEPNLMQSGEVHVAGARDEIRLRELARYLSTGERSSSVLPIDAPESPPSRERSRPWLGYAAGIGALGAFALGGVSLDKAYGCSSDANCNASYPGAEAIGYTSMGVGLALSALALYLVFREPSPVHPPSIAVTSGLMGMMGPTISWTREF